MMDTTWDMDVESPPPRNKISRLVWKPVFGFYSGQQFKVSLLILYSDTRKKNHGCLINKTEGPQYSVWCLPPGISMSQLSALMVCRYLDFDGCISLGSIHSIHSFCVQGFAEHFVPRGNHVKHAKVKVWSSSPIIPNVPYYLFEMSECRNSFLSAHKACEDTSSHWKDLWGCIIQIWKGDKVVFCLFKIRSFVWSLQ